MTKTCFQNPFVTHFFTLFVQGCSNGFKVTCSLSEHFDTSVHAKKSNFFVIMTCTLLYSPSYPKILEISFFAEERIAFFLKNGWLYNYLSQSSEKVKGFCAKYSANFSVYWKFWSRGESLMIFKKWFISRKTFCYQKKSKKLSMFARENIV